MLNVCGKMLHLWQNAEFLWQHAECLLQNAECLWQNGECLWQNAECLWQNAEVVLRRVRFASSWWIPEAGLDPAQPRRSGECGTGGDNTTLLARDNTTMPGKT